MDRRVVLAVLLGALVVLAGCGQTSSGPGTSAAPTATDSPRSETASPPGTTEAPGGTTAGPGGTTAPPTSSGPPTDTDAPDGEERVSPPDPPSDRLAWEGGVWYNETLGIDQSDGLNETELDLVVNRSMARVERIREMEFERTVPVDVVTRSTYREKYANSSNATAALRTFDNVKFEALFLVGEDRDSLAVQERNRGSNVLGFYSPRDDSIVVVSDSDTPSIAETTLGHELVHAMQWGHFEMDAFNSSTREGHNARNGVVEGDARYVDSIYGDRCSTAWSCVTESSSGGGGGDLHLGVYLLKYFPYSDGPGFVQYHRSQGGWAAVNDLYRTPPESAEQVIRPPAYREDHPTNVTLADRSGGEWTRVTPEGRAPYGSVGQASLTAMFAYTAYEQDRHPQSFVLHPQAFLNSDQNGEVQSSDPIDYNVSYASGWDGDKLWAYENADGETAYAWRLVWDTEADAREFADGYRQLLQYWGAERVDGSAGVWRIPEGESGFADAFYLRVDGDAVTVVNAPTVEGLSAVHSTAP